MPELPEVEATRRSLFERLVGRRIERVVVRERRLRWPIPTRLPRALTGRVVCDLGRRAKYLLVRTDAGTVISHLGMSGSFSWADPGTPPDVHDHFDWIVEGGDVLRYHDPRRFGALLWTSRPPEEHRLLRALGIEPLPTADAAGSATGGVDGEYLYAKSRSRRIPVRNLIMDGRIVVGVGNIYASEACFQAGVRPDRAAGRISRARYDRLADAIRATLQSAIEAGGTTLRDFHDAGGRTGEFRHRLAVYGREGEPCHRCGGTVRRGVASGRSYYYCHGCQR